VATEVDQLDVHILDREYRLAVAPKDKDTLLDAVRIVDERMRAIRDAGKVAGADRIAVMAALQLAHELLAGGGPGSARARDAAVSSKRVRKMTEDIDAELKRQENLF
jgi:cell division protein ZapA